MERSAELGTGREIALEQGTVRYFDRGEGRPVLFLHGLLVNAELWRKVIPEVAEAGFRCVAPDLPLGAHEIPLAPGADAGPEGVVRLIADLLDELDLRDVLVVANDTGGALTQLLITRHPERIAAVVLTPSDAFELFFPPPFSVLQTLARLPGFGLALTTLARSKAVQRSPLGFGFVAKHGIPRHIVDRYLLPSRRSAGVRRDLRAFVSRVDNRLTVDAARRLRDFTKPVLLAWASEDRVFPLELAHRLAGVLPAARLIEIPDSYAFVPEDQPGVLAGHIVEFAGAMEG